MKIGIAADHAGRELKQLLIAALNPAPRDYGVHDEGAVDYPDYAYLLAKAVDCGELERGIAICGTGSGMAIVANRFPNVRAVNVWSKQTCLLSRIHNDANIICLGAHLLDHTQAIGWTQLWFNTAFSGEERHCRRITKTVVCA